MDEKSIRKLVQDELRQFHKPTPLERISAMVVSIGVCLIVAAILGLIFEVKLLRDDLDRTKADALHIAELFAGQK